MQPVANRYFIVGASIREIREWNLPEFNESYPPDCRYFGLALAQMEKSLGGLGLRIFVTWNNDELPEYGSSVVVLLIGEEFRLVPRYSRHVLAVFKTTGGKPFLGIRKWRIDLLRMMLLLRYFRDLVTYFASVLRARWTPRAWPDRIKTSLDVLDVPLGYYKFDLLPGKPMADRKIAIFFAGTIKTLTTNLLRKLLPSPKMISRIAMKKALEQLATPRETENSKGLSVVTSDGLSQADYSALLMNARVCLAPRGNIPDTYRYFEGACSGCLVVCEPLPDSWYYSNSPALQLDDWNDLAASLANLIGDDRAMEELRVKTLGYWETSCSETSLGMKMAEHVRCQINNRSL